MDLIERKAVVDTINLYFAVTFDALEQSDETYDLKIFNLLTHLKKGLITAIETMPSAHPTQTNTPNALKALDCVGRRAAIDAVRSYYDECDTSDKSIEERIEELPSAQPEPLTDKEQRIFLAAMGREEKVCEEVDRNYVREPYEDSLMSVCREIKRKVKGALWT